MRGSQEKAIRQAEQLGGRVKGDDREVLLRCAVCRRCDGGMIMGSDRSLLSEADEILNTYMVFFMQSGAEGLSVQIRRCLMVGNS